MWYDSYMTHNIENTKNDSQRIILESDKILKLSHRQPRDNLIRNHSVKKKFRNIDVKGVISSITYFQFTNFEASPPTHFAQVDTDFSIFMGYLISSIIWPSPFKFLTNLTNHRIYLKHAPLLTFILAQIVSHQSDTGLHLAQQNLPKKQDFFLNRIFLNFKPNF